MVAGCGEEEECQNKVLPFFDGEEYVTETFGGSNLLLRTDLLL